MPAMNSYAVTLQQVRPREIASVRARVRMGQVPAVFRDYLDRVYAVGKSGAALLDGQNVFVYRQIPDVPDQLDVDFGVGLRASFAPVDGVRSTTVPGGHVVTTTHWGDYGKLRGAHDAIQAWIQEHMARFTGTSWEVYGHWPKGPEPPRTDIFYLIESSVKEEP